MTEKTIPRFAFFGTPSFAVLVLEELSAAGLRPAIVVTTPDRPAGRGLALTESPVKKWALANAIPVLQPEKLDAEFATSLRATNCSLLLVAAYGKILPESILGIPEKGALNIHPSLLPRYRGTSPVESQILADEKEIGVSIISMDEKTDHGPLVAQEKIDVPHWPIPRNVLNDLLWKTGGRLFVQICEQWVRGEIPPEPQDESRATFTKKIKKEDGQIDVLGNARENYLKYLAYEGWYCTFFFSGGKRVKITQARFEQDSFIIDRVIPEGEREMPYEDYTASATHGA